MRGVLLPLLLATLVSSQYSYYYPGDPDPPTITCPSVAAVAAAHTAVAADLSYKPGVDLCWDCGNSYDGYHSGDFEFGDDIIIPVSAGRCGLVRNNPRKTSAHREKAICNYETGGNDHAPTGITAVACAFNRSRPIYAGHGVALGSSHYWLNSDFFRCDVGWMYNQPWRSYLVGRPAVNPDVFPYTDLNNIIIGLEAGGIITQSGICGTTILSYCNQRATYGTKGSTYRYLTNETVVCACNVGSWQGSLCTVCPAGSYLTNAGADCVACPAGRHQSSAAQSVCDLCPANSYSAMGAISCSSCAAGSYSVAGASACLSCPVGRTATAAAQAITPFNWSAAAEPYAMIAKLQLDASYPPDVAKFVYGSVAAPQVLQPVTIVGRLVTSGSDYGNAFAAATALETYLRALPATVVPQQLGGKTWLPGVYSDDGANYGLRMDFPATFDAQWDPAARFVFVSNTAGQNMFLFGAMNFTNGAQPCQLVFVSYAIYTSANASANFIGDLNFDNDPSLSITGRAFASDAGGLGGVVFLEANTFTGFAACQTLVCGVPCAAGRYSATGAGTCTACAAGRYANTTGATVCLTCGSGFTVNATVGCINPCTVNNGGCPAKKICALNGGNRTCSCPTGSRTPYLLVASGNLAGQGAALSTTFLTRIDLDTGTKVSSVPVKIGAAGASLQGLDMLESGRTLWTFTSSASLTSPSHLATISAATGVVSIFATAGVGVDDIVWSPDGTQLYGVTAGKLYQVSSSTGIGTLLGSQFTGTNYASLYTPIMSAVTCFPLGGTTVLLENLWEITKVRNAAATQYFFMASLISRTTGRNKSTIVRWPTTSTALLGGATTLDDAVDALYVVTDEADGGSNLYKFSTATGQTSLYLANVGSQISAVALADFAVLSTDDMTCPKKCPNSLFCTVSPYLFCNSSSLCDVCQPGTFASATACVNCAGGKYTNRASLTVCASCSPGKKSNAGIASTGCIDCTGNTFQANVGKSSCTNCATGFTANATHTGCSCAAGSSLSLSGTACALCATGKFSNATAVTACTLCSSNTITLSRGATVCVQCAAGKTANATHSGCVCETGRFGTSCALCAAGKYSNTIGAAACTFCSGATFQDSTGKSTCTNCATGFTGNATHTGCVDIDECLSDNGGCSRSPLVACTNTEGSRTCASCPLGYNGTSSGANCTACRPGQYGTSPGVCALCPAGRYQPNSGHTSCLACSAAGLVVLPDGSGCGCPANHRAPTLLVASGSSGQATLERRHMRTGAIISSVKVTADGLPVSLTGLAEQWDTGILFGLTGNNSPNLPQRLIRFTNVTGGRAVSIGHVVDVPTNPTAGDITFATNDTQTLFAVLELFNGNFEAVGRLNLTSAALSGIVVSDEMFSQGRSGTALPVAPGVSGQQPSLWRIDLPTDPITASPLLWMTVTQLDPATLQPISAFNVTDPLPRITPITISSGWRPAAATVTAEQDALLVLAQSGGSGGAHVLRIDPFTQEIRVLYNLTSMPTADAITQSGAAQSNTELLSCPYVCSSDNDCAVWPKLRCNSTGFCDRCAAGRFAEKPFTQCTGCAAGKSSSAGATLCGDCGVGRFSNASSVCQACGAGRYANTTGATACLTCPSGYTASVSVGCTDTNECLVGNGGCSLSPLVSCTNTAGSRLCGGCPLGYNGTSSGANCTACRTGQYGTSPGVCAPCPAGYYNDSARGAATQCDACDAGKIAALPGSTGCALCTGNTFVASSTNQTACVACATGKTADDPPAGCSLAPASSTASSSSSSSTAAAATADLVGVGVGTKSVKTAMIVVAAVVGVGVLAGAALTATTTAAGVSVTAAATAAGASSQTVTVAEYLNSLVPAAAAPVAPVPTQSVTVAEYLSSLVPVGHRYERVPERKRSVL